VNERTAVARTRTGGGRQLLTPGTHGIINVQGTKDYWVARARVRDGNGEHTSLQRRGNSRQEAIDNLRAAIASRPGFDLDAQAAQGIRVTGARDNLSANKAEAHAVYRMFDTDGCLLYVGISLSVAHRMSRHRREKQWWSDIAKIELTHYLDHDSARAAERDAIQDEAPLYNIQA
jgi:hypothetical protein